MHFIIRHAIWRIFISTLATLNVFFISSLATLNVFLSHTSVGGDVIWDADLQLTIPDCIMYVFDCIMFIQDCIMFIFDCIMHGQSFRKVGAVSKQFGSLLILSPNMLIVFHRKYKYKYKYKYKTRFTFYRRPLRDGWSWMVMVLTQVQVS